jgi:flagellar secretion chaperone FliS
MRTKGYQRYFENELQETSPLRLVLMLYRGALDAIACARRHLRAGDIRARSQAISKAMAIVTELSLSLEKERGGELSRNLAALYAYAEKLLIQANFEQREKPLEEVEGLLSTLLEGWTACVPEEPAIERSERTTQVNNEDYERVSCSY